MLNERTFAFKSRGYPIIRWKELLYALAHMNYKPRVWWRVSSQKRDVEPRQGVEMAPVACASIAVCGGGTKEQV